MDVVVFLIVVGVLVWFFTKYWLIPCWNKGWERGKRK